ncbi:UvrD-helicase domain-containing protein [Limisphaera sp. 4302-co]|uniref:UvrD-helicase domain-containing protein n=1 Tax=Limisphaera sp. 4302-co TaxID=3400417 RepID=UPI003C14EB4C
MSQNASGSASPRLTPAQQQAVTATGNVLVMAGAGTGKTRTLVERVLRLLLPDRTPHERARQPARVTDLLVVTFTEAAAAELRERIRHRLEETARQEDSPFWHEQLALLDTAAIGTLHSFCYRLIREHFAELDLDPRLTVLEEGQARLLQHEVFDEVLEAVLGEPGRESDQLRALFTDTFAADVRRLRERVLEIHDYIRSLPDPDQWLAEQSSYLDDPNPTKWQEWLPEAFEFWRERWQARIEALANAGNPAARLLLSGLPGPQPDRPAPAAGLDAWRRYTRNALRSLEEGLSNRSILKKHQEELRHCIRDLQLLARWAGESGTATGPQGSASALATDWQQMRVPMRALLELTRRFARALAERKRERGWLDFSDLEQFALDLLWDREKGRPTDLAGRLRARFRWVFVDEYQDINPAQDLILQALSSEPGNRFLVGDVKQSIYRFRRADPAIFRSYARRWAGERSARVIPLQENFRSLPLLLKFVNAVFERIMQEAVGGVGYGQDAQLLPGTPVADGSTAPGPGESSSGGEPPVEICLWQPPGANVPRNPASGNSGETAEDSDAIAELSRAEEEALWLARRLRELREQGFQVRDPQTGRPRPIRYADMAVLLRSPGPKSEIYLQQFEAAGVPLEVSRKEFFGALEVSDLLNLLRLLDNPLQDLPLLAVLRSPIVGLTLDEMAWVCAHRRDLPVWQRLRRWLEEDGTGPAGGPVGDSLRRKLQHFLQQHARWRQWARLGSVSRCLEVILSDTRYLAWVESQPAGRFRRLNVDRCLELARDFDRIHGEGLTGFLRRIEAWEETETEPEVAPEPGTDAVRLLSIHQSKGLEFPLVAVADLGKPFNVQDLHAQVIVDERYGPASRILTPDGRWSYPSLASWLAQQRQHKENLGEEIRLLYVAFTRARDYLLLVGQPQSRTAPQTGPQPPPAHLLEARSPLDWLLPVFTELGLAPARTSPQGRAPLFRWRWITPEERSTLKASPAAEPTGPAARGEATESPERAEAPAENLWSEITRLRQLDYPHRRATVEPAKTSVTAAQRRWTEEEPPAVLFRTAGPRERRFPVPPLTAVERGAAHHRFLRFFNLDTASTPDLLRAEADRLVRAGRLTREEAGALDFPALGRFWQSDVGRRILQHRHAVRRELEFTLRLQVNELRQIAGGQPVPDLAEEFVVLQGAVDLAVILPGELWLLDFKTDDVRDDELDAKVRTYATQLRLYGLALERIYRRPVRHRWLHFLRPGRTVEVTGR